MHHRFLPVALALATSLAVAHDVEAQAGFYVDAELGIKIKPPSGWVLLGHEGDRGCLRVMYAATKSSTPKGGGFPHRPMMRVMFFAKSNADRARSGDFPMRDPYPSFDKYLLSVYGDLTRKKSSEDATFGEMEGKLVTAHPRGNEVLALYSFVAPRDNGDLVIEVETLTQDLSKNRKALEKALKSLAAVDAEAPAAAEAPEWETDFAAWRKKSRDERYKARTEWGKAWLEAKKAVDHPKWKSKQAGPYLVMSRTDSKTTKRITEAATVALKWAEERFREVSDDSLMPAVIKIFDSREEHDAYRSREALPRPYHTGRREIYAFKDPNQGNTGEGHGVLLRGIVQHVLHDKDPHIMGNLPRWFDLGLSEYLRSTKITKKKGIEFFSSTTETARLKWWIQNGREIPATWNLIQESIQPSPEGGAVEDPWEYVTECSRLLRWFESGGNESFKTPDFMVSYFKAIAAAGATEPPDPALDVDTSMLKDDQVAELNKRQYARRDALLIKVNDTAFNITQDDWFAANEKWVAFNNDFK